MSLWPIRTLAIAALMEGKASDPRAWPAPFRLDGSNRAAMLDIGGHHLVRANENADLSELRP